MKFLEETFALLSLEGISAIHGRAEEYAKNKAYREKYDLCVSRAVSGLATLSEYCLPYVKVGGLFVSYKSGSVKEEAEAAEKAVNTREKQERRSENHWHNRILLLRKCNLLSNKRRICVTGDFSLICFTKLSQIYPTFITNYFYTIIR